MLAFFHFRDGDFDLGYWCAENPSKIPSVKPYSVNYLLQTGMACRNIIFPAEPMWD